MIFFVQFNNTVKTK